MTDNDHDLMPIPRGIWYEADRGRWRVRLYRRARIIYTSYHPTLAQALKAFAHAKEQQALIRQNDKEIGTQPVDQLRALREGLI